MNLPLAGRTALVTGGGRGIGRAIALALAEDGADIAVNYRRDDAAAEKTVADIEALGRRAHAYAADVADFEQCESMVGAAVAELGPIDILVNNVGVASRGGPVNNTEPIEVHKLFDTHAYGAWSLSKLVIPGMRTKPRGDIVMTSSAATLH